MKKVYLFFVVIIALFAIAVAGEGDKWFDMENCAFCKHLTTDPNFLPNSSWNHYMISNGFVNITTYKPEVKTAWDEVNKNMEETGKKMMAGEKLQMCGMCTDMGMLMQAGANFEIIEIENGSFMMVTSDDPAMVAKLQAHAQKNIDEMKKMMKMMESHEGHDHGDHTGHNH